MSLIRGPLYICPLYIGPLCTCPLYRGPLYWGSIYRGPHGDLLSNLNSIPSYWVFIPWVFI